MHHADLFHSDHPGFEGTEGADDRVNALFELLRRPEWYADALCKEYPTSLFFPDKGQATARAKALCRRCTVRAECAEAGAAEPVGIWGGLTAQARKKAQHRDP